MNAQIKRRLLAAGVILILAAMPTIWLATRSHQARLDADLYRAVRLLDGARVDLLLAEGANPSARRGPRKPLWRSINDILHPKPDLSPTMLMWTIQPHSANISPTEDKASVHIVRSLVAKHADVTATNEIGETALTLAATYGRSDCLVPLVEGGANINSTARVGTTPLERACAVRNNTTCARDLILLGADVNTMDNYGYTPLMVASQLGNTTIIKCLIDAHADVNATSDGIRSALKLAEFNKQTTAASILRAAGAK